MTAPGRLDLSDRVIQEPRQSDTKLAVVIWRCLRAMIEAKSSCRLVLPPDRPLLHVMPK
jgi:hypothetical protein